MQHLLVLEEHVPYLEDLQKLNFFSSRGGVLPHQREEVGHLLLKEPDEVPLHFFDDLVDDIDQLVGQLGRL